MIELLSKFSVDQIIIYAIMLAFAIKGTIDFFDWIRVQYKKKFDKDYAEKEKDKNLLTIEEKIDNLTSLTNQRMDTIEKRIDGFEERADAFEIKMNKLTKSDMHDIKGWIVEKHHLLTKRNYVDDFTMDILEKRYEDYVSEGGNSYIEKLMNEIRALPHFPSDLEEAKSEKMRMK